MASRSIEAGKAFLKLLVDDKQFGPGLDQSLRKLNSFGNAAIKAGAGLTALGGLLSAPFVGAVAVFKSVGDELYTLSQRTGIGVKSLSELKYAAEQSGTSLGAIERAARSLQKQGLDPAKFDEIAASIAAIPDPVQRAQAAFKAFGKSGSEIIPLLNDLPQLRKEAQELGLTMSPEAAAAADALDDAFKALKMQGQALAITIGDALTPAVLTAADVLTQVNKRAIEFAGANQGLIQVMAAVAISIVSLGSALTALGITVRGVTTAIYALRTAFTFLARHPYLIAIGLGITALTAIASRFIDLGDAVEEANEPTREHADIQQDLADALANGTEQVDARTEALGQLTDAERKAVAAIEDRKRAEAVDKEEKKLRRSIQEDDLIRQREQAAANVRTLEGTEEQQRRRGITGRATLNGMDIDDYRRKVRELTAELRDLRGESSILFSDRAEGGFPLAFMPGMLLAIQQSAKFFQSVGRRDPTGKQGFDTDKFSEQVSKNFGAQSLFRKELAPQVFGGGGGLVQIARQQLSKAEKILKVMERVERKLPGTVGPGFKNAFV
jgi:hypothetical protein